MAKGTIAKQNIGKKLQELFGDNFVGESGGKYYVWENDGGEKVQIAISLTCPKNPIGTVDMSSAFGDGIDFDAAPAVGPVKVAPTEITEEEKANLAAMMASLGL